MKHPLVQLTLARIREFYREPAAVFWVYCFPILIAIALGIAFREKPVEKITIDIREDTGLATEALTEKLKQDRAHHDSSHDRRRVDETAALRKDRPGDRPANRWRLRTLGRAKPCRERARPARAGEHSLSPCDRRPVLEQRHVEETGNRYIDFLLPGLLGMNLMGGGLFGVGFVLADMRMRKLLKRFLATPMKRRDFLFSVLLSRVIFTVPEVLVLLIFGRFAFGVRNQGDIASLIFLIVLGAFCFGGLGLLVASRAKTIETVSGLMNLVMLPMYIVSGVFFSSERFPELVQPLIKVLPLTAMNDSLRGVMLEGKSLAELGWELGVLLIWGGLSFAIALKIFRWR